MKFNFKNVIILLIVGLMILGIIMPIFAEDKPPYSDETYWNDKCAGIGYNNNKSNCAEYKQFLLAKIKDSNQSLKSVESDLEVIRKDIKKYGDEVLSYESQIKTLESSAATIKASIRTAEADIDALENQIVERIETIAEKEQRVKDYISVSQGQMRVNGYVEFVMGAKDFSDIVMRMEGLNRIKTFNEDLINELKSERAALEEDKLAVENQRELLVIEKETLEVQIKHTAALKEASNTIMLQLHKLESEAEAKADAIATTIAMDKEKSDSLKEKIVALPPSGSWTNPLRGGYRVVSKGWYYTNGYPHNGTDLGVDRGTPLVAVGSGIVASTFDGCGEGSPGNTCGYSYGNRVNIIVNIDGVIYGIVNAHLTAGSLTVSPGQLVSAGQVLGTTGNSGASTGPHYHMEIIRFAESNVVDAYSNWGNSPNFGTGSASSSGRRICAWGAGAPCRIDPATIYGW